ncbi:MAG: helix-turn-helix transcriptional regulator [Flavobacteriaceae bacterium]|nr:helix-turn-helix transcriptional regulator [Flavobacteriaceae bacterium]
MYKEYKINNGLDAFIDCVWKDNQVSDKYKSDFLVVPDNTVELVFTSNSVDRKVKDQNLCTVKSHLCGLKTKPQLVGIKGEVLLSVRFKPYGLYPFTNIDLNETIDKSIQPEDIFGKEILNLEESLFNCKEEELQVKLVESFFANKFVKTNRDKDKIFDFFVARIIAHKGNISIEELAESINISKKTIERKFFSKLGITPKRYCRIVRMFHALKIPKNPETFKLSSIAIDNGFYDQAHFIKEVKQFTGMTPKDYFGIDRTIQTNIFMP